MTPKPIDGENTEFLKLIQDCEKNSKYHSYLKTYISTREIPYLDGTTLIVEKICTDESFLQFSLTLKVVAKDHLSDCIEIASFHITSEDLIKRFKDESHPQKLNMSLMKYLTCNF